jgi:hypothetical protein
MVLVTVVRRVSVVIAPVVGLCSVITEAVAVIGQMVVERRMVSVVMEGVLEEAGQSSTFEGQATIVAVRVLKTVEVVYITISVPTLSVIFDAEGRLDAIVIPYCETVKDSLTKRFPAASVEGTEVAVVATSVAVTGQMVVDTMMVSVVMEVVLEEAGQSSTLEGQAVIVVVRVLKMVDVVNDGVEASESFAGCVPGVEGVVVGKVCISAVEPDELSMIPTVPVVDPKVFAVLNLGNSAAAGSEEGPEILLTSALLETVVVAMIVLRADGVP